MIGFYRRFFNRQQEESREARLNRLAREIRSMTEEDRKMFFHRVYGNDLHIHKNPPKGRKKNGEKNESAGQT